MTTLGYALSSEEHRPNELVRNASRAENAGFEFALISDHFHPWLDEQGHSPFVWSVIGAIAHATERLRLGTGVTCPTTRIHPAIIAQAAATAACMMPDRFFLGVGTGENLNEHILGDRWPAYDRRAEKLVEAIKVIRMLWEGRSQTYYGRHYTIENARIYTLPENAPPILIAASGTTAAEMASEHGDGLISTAPSAETVSSFQANGKDNRPCYGQMTVCCAESEFEARKIAYQYWRNAALHGELSQILPTPTHFEQATRNVTEDEVAETILCGNNPSRHIEQIEEYSKAGFDYIYVHQVGPNQDAFFDFYERDILPRYQE